MKHKRDIPIVKIANSVYSVDLHHNMPLSLVNPPSKAIQRQKAIKLTVPNNDE